MKDFLKSASMLLGCIALARFILPANFTPLIAMAVFMPHLTNNKNLQLFLPVSLLFLTDIVLGFYGTTMLFVYGTMLLIGVLSRYLHKDNLQTVLGNSVLSVVLWHLIVNLGVYLNGLGTVTLLETYALAIPFDIRLLTSTLIFATMFFTLKQFITKNELRHVRRI
tara:strand:+ start:491 stop:988 length:498 start_codon:yes stop_codon:yes gene_type:complete